MGDTIEDMDIEREQKSKKVEFSESKIGLPDSTVVDEMNRLGVKKYRRKENVIGLWIR